jgi:hypothetical protein
MGFVREFLRRKINGNWSDGYHWKAQNQSKYGLLRYNVNLLFPSASHIHEITARHDVSFPSLVQCNRRRRLPKFGESFVLFGTMGRDISSGVECLYLHMCRYFIHYPNRTSRAGPHSGVKLPLSLMTVRQRPYPIEVAAPFFTIRSTLFPYIKSTSPGMHLLEVR